MVSRDGFGSGPVPRQPAHLHTQAQPGAYGIPPEFRGGVHLFDSTIIRHPSGQSRLLRVTQLRTDDIHCRESAGTGPVNLEVVPNGCCLGRSPWTNKYAPFFLTLIIGMVWACSKYRGYRLTVSSKTRGNVGRGGRRKKSGRTAWQMLFGCLASRGTEEPPHWTLGRGITRYTEGIVGLWARGSGKKKTRPINGRRREERKERTRSG